jgi:hypothetical protein
MRITSFITDSDLSIDITDVFAIQIQNQGTSYFTVNDGYRVKPDQLLPIYFPYNDLGQGRLIIRFLSFSDVNSCHILITSK